MENVLLLLMTTAIFAAARSGDTLTLIALELSLAGLTWSFRLSAKRRWRHLDWMQCRPDAAGRFSAAASG